MLGPSAFPIDGPSEQPFEDYRRLTRSLLLARPEQLSLADDAHAAATEIRRYLHELEQASGGLAQGFQAFVGKMAGLSGSLALILHMASDPLHGNATPISRTTTENVGRLVKDFILPHAFEFYRTAETVTDGDRLQKIASYILTSGKTRIVSSDLTRNVAHLQGLTLFDVNRRVSPLVAGDWLSPVEPGPVTRSWAINSDIFAQFEERCRIEEERKSRLAELMRSPRRARGSTHAA